MRKIALFIMLALASVQTTFGQMSVMYTMPADMKEGDTWYVLKDLDERWFTTNWGSNYSTVYEWADKEWKDAIGDVLTFKAWRWPEGSNPVDVYLGVNDVYEEIPIWSKNPGKVIERDGLGLEKTIEPVSYPDDDKVLYVGEKTRQVKFSSYYMGKYNKYVDDVRVTMAKYLYFNRDTKTTTHILNFPVKIINTGEESQSFTFEWANIKSEDVVITNNTQAFTINTLAEYTKEGAWGKTQLTVTCDYKKAGRFENEVISIYNKEINQTILLYLNVEVRDVKPQVITWNQDFVLPVGTVVDLNATTNSDLPLTYKSADESIAKIEGNKLTIVGIGETIITASNAGDAEWFEVSQSKTVVGYNPDKADCVKYKSWPDATLKNAVLDKNDKKQELTWDSGLIPTTLSGTAKNEAVVDIDGTNLKIEYTGSTENQTKNQTKNIKANSSVSLNEKLSNDVTKIILSTSDKELKLTDIKVYFETYIKASETKVEFGTIGWKQTVVSKEITVDYSMLPNLHRIKLVPKNYTNNVYTLIDKNGNIATEIGFSEDCTEVGKFTFNVQFSSENLTADDLGTTYEAELQFLDKNGNTITYAPSSIPVTGTFDISPRWLPIVPKLTEESVTPTTQMYAHMLYWELADDVKAQVKASRDYATLNSTEDITVVGSQYMLFQATADNWRSFVAPFDVQNAYVIELMPEPDQNEMSASDRDNLRSQQTQSIVQFYEYLQTEIVTNDSHDNLIELINAYCATVSGSGIYPLEHFNGNNSWTFTHYLYHSSASMWPLNTSGEGQSSFVQQWEEVGVMGNIMERGETYAMNFPYCMDCPDYTGWDYWTGKLILIEHKGEQKIQGTHAANNFTAEVVSGVATLTGNSFLATVPVSSVDRNVYEHDVTSDLYKLVESDKSVKPTASLMYADIPATPTKRAIAIKRTGEIIWENDEVEDNNSGVVTGVEQIAGASIQCFIELGGFSIISSITQPIAIYTINGTLVYTGEVIVDERKSFELVAGLYILRTTDSVLKVRVQ